MSATRRAVLALAVLATVAAAPAARAEPAFAVRTGHRCSQCHVNRTGGGLRTEYGSLYTQLVLPARTLQVPGAGGLLPADPGARFAFGADVRGRYLAVEPATGEDVGTFELARANAFGELRLVPGRLSLYVDETLGPGGAGARELFALVALPGPRAYLKVGKLLPAFGWRLPDDDALVRRVTGFTYSAPDTGLELGLEPGRFSFHVSATNGSAGATDDNRAKRFALRSERRIGPGRIGFSASNDLPSGARVTQGGLYGGINLGRLALLGEVDWRELSEQGVEIDGFAALAEADLLIRRGLNLELAHDYFDPDIGRSTDARTRDTLGLEYTPFPFVQLRALARAGDGPPIFPGVRDDQLELELHVFF